MKKEKITIRIDCNITWCLFYDRHVYNHCCKTMVEVEECETWKKHNKEKGGLK